VLCGAGGEFRVGGDKGGVGLAQLGGIERGHPAPGAAVSGDR